MRSTPSTQLFRLLPCFAIGALALSASSGVQAHITLMNPPSWVMEDAEGDPQKQAPCGGVANANGVTPTNTVTPFQPGETIPVMWKETIGHPGHFRISIAKDRAELVDPPVETENGDGVSGDSISAMIMDPVAAPVALDGLFPRPTVSGPQAAPFMQMVTLPTEPGRYTLQVIQFMAQHAPGYFYHHCADIEIMADGPSSGSGGSGADVVGQAGSASTGTGGSSSAAAGSGGSGSTPIDDDNGGGDDDGGGCAVVRMTSNGGRASVGALALLGLAALVRRRRAH